MKQVICKSGLVGWRGRLQENYVSFGEFKSYCGMYKLHTRIGFATPEAAWKANPLIEGSVNPDDLRRVLKHKKKLPKKT